MPIIQQEVCIPQTWLEERVYVLLQYFDMKRPEQIDLQLLCSAFSIEVQSIIGRSRTHALPSLANRYVIAVDERLELAHQRVKIAHELGHLLLHEAESSHMNEWGSDVLHTFVGDTEALRHWIRFHQTFANKPLCRYKDTASNPQGVDLAASRSHAPGSRRYRYDFFKNP
jgi:hypothetical protein